MKKTAGREIPNQDLLDPNKRYLVCRISKVSSFVDYVSPREDEFLKVSVSFLDH